MKANQIREFTKRAPFVKFDIRTSDGRVYTVEHPEFAMLSPAGSSLAYYTEDDRLIVIDCAQIVSLELANRPSAA